MRVKQGKGVFVVLEGPDGSGKTQACKMIVEQFQKEFPDREVLHLVAPHHGELREYLLKEREVPIPAETEILVFLAGHEEQTAMTIVPALARGAIVVCDRYLESLIAYQGYGRERLITVQALVSILKLDRVKPDVTVTLDTSEATTAQRMAEREGNNRMDKQSKEFYSRVRVGYRLQQLERQRRNRDQMTIQLDNNSTLQNLYAGCEAFVKSYSQRIRNEHSTDTLTLQRKAMAKRVYDSSVLHLNKQEYILLLQGAMSGDLINGGDGIQSIFTTPIVPIDTPALILNAGASGVYKYSSDQEQDPHQPIQFARGEPHLVMVFDHPTPRKVITNLNTLDCWIMAEHYEGTTLVPATWRPWVNNTLQYVNVRELLDIAKALGFRQ